MQEMLLAHKDILLKIEDIEKRIGTHDEKINLIFEYLKELLTKPNPPRELIGFKRHD
jgi:hypothetical protein